MSDDENEFDDEELPEELKGKGKKFGVIKASERIGKEFLKFLKDFEDMTNKLDSLEDERAKQNVENYLVAAIGNARVALNRDFYAMPFAVMHRVQKFPEDYDEHAQQLCALLSADLVTLKVLTDTVGEVLQDLNEYMEPKLRKRQREARRKEGSAAPASTTAGGDEEEDSGPRSNVLDFAERRGRVKDKPRTTTYH